MSEAPDINNMVVLVKDGIASLAELDIVKRSIRPIRIAASRSWGRVQGFRFEDVADNAFIEAIRTFDPNRSPSFRSWYRQTLYRRLQDHVKSLEFKNASKDELSESHAQVDAVLELIPSIKEFLIVAIAYANTNELRAMQGMILGETCRETAVRVGGQPVHINQAQKWISAAAHLFGKGLLTWPPPPSLDGIREVRRLIAAQVVADKISRRRSHKKS